MSALPLAPPITSKKPSYRGNPSMMPALSSKNRLVAGVGVCDAVYREFLFGRGPSAWGELPSSRFSSVGRVCSRCYRKRSRNFVASRLSYDTTRRILDFTASDSAECWYF